MKSFFTLPVICLFVVGSPKKQDISHQNRSFYLFFGYNPAIYSPQAVSASSSVFAHDESQNTLFDSMDDLEFVDLANIASVSSRFQKLITEHYIIPPSKFNLDQAEIHISILTNPSDNEVKHVTTKDLTQSPELTHGRAEVLSTLKAFCSTFSKVTVPFSYSQDMEYLAKLVNTLNNHCDTVAQRIRFFHVNGLSTDTKLSFNHATDVHLSFPKFSGAVIADLFPRMEQLEISLMKSYTLNQQFSHLTSFILSEAHLLSETLI